MNLEAGENPTRTTAAPGRPAAMGSPLGMRFLALVLRVFPLQIAYLVAVVPVVWYYLTRPEGRSSAAILYRRLGLPGGRWRQFWFGFLSFSRIILDNMILGIFGPERFELKEIGTEIFEKALARGKGLVLLSAHMGNWHLAVNFLWNTGTRVHLIIDDTRQEEVRRQMDAAKAASRHLEVHAASEDSGLVFPLSSALKRGEVVIIAGDRAPRTGRRIRVPFLGQDAWFPTSGLAIAATVDAPVCTALTFRTGSRRYECHGLGPFDAAGMSTGKRARIDAMAKAFVAHLETFVRRYPTQWFNFFDFWKAD